MLHQLSCLLRALLLLQLFLPLTSSQQKELALVASSNFRMILSPTITKLLKESSTSIQDVATSRLKLEQGDSDREYAPDRTKVVFQSVQLDDRNFTSIRFFALASEWTVSVPSGTSFRDVRVKAAEVRQTAFNELVDSVLNDFMFLEGVHDAATTALSSNILPLAVVTQLLAIKSIAVASIQPAASNPNDSGLQESSSSSSNKLTPADVILICLSALILCTIVFCICFQSRRCSSIGSSETDEAYSPSNTAVPVPVANAASKDKKRAEIESDGDTMTAGNTLIPAPESSYMTFVNGIIASSIAASNNNVRGLPTDEEAGKLSGSSGSELTEGGSDQMLASTSSASGVTDSDSYSGVSHTTSCSDSTISVLVSTVRKAYSTSTARELLEQVIGHASDADQLQTAPATQGVEAVSAILMEKDDAPLTEPTESLSNTFDKKFFPRCEAAAKRDIRAVFRPNSAAGASNVDVNVASADLAALSTRSVPSVPKSSQSEPATTPDWMKTIRVVTSSGSSKSASLSSISSPPRISDISPSDQTISSAP